MITRDKAYEFKKEAKKSLINCKVAVIELEKALNDKRNARILQGFGDAKTNEAQREAIIQIELAPEYDALARAKTNLLKAQGVYDNACLDVNFVDFRVDSDE